MSSQLFKNARLIDANRDEIGDLLIENGRIRQVGGKISLREASKTKDCSGKIILPGVIDPHVHMGVPIKDGQSADDFRSGSRAAIHGGVTTILDFTVLQQEESLHASIERRKSEAADSLCDFGLHCNVTRFSPQLLQEIPAIISAGINSFKTFTTYSEAGMMLTYKEIGQLAEVLSVHAALLMVHAEDEAVIQTAIRPLRGRGYTEPIYHGQGRPAQAEIKAIEQLARISRTTNCQIYIVHLNTAEGLRIALEEGLLVETCPQYLFLDEGRYAEDDGRMYVASPPLRTQEDANTLWRALLEGRINTIGTDHCPFNLEQKPVDSEFEQIKNGLGGVETCLPLLLARFLESGSDLKTLARTMCAEPARIFGLSDRKGLLSEGLDADIVLLDPAHVTREWDHSKVSEVDWTAYADLPALFPNQVYRRGELVLQHGTINETGKGEFIPALV